MRNDLHPDQEVRAGSGRKTSDIVGRRRQSFSRVFRDDFRPGYCFHDPAISGVFLANTVTSPRSVLQNPVAGTFDLGTIITYVLVRFPGRTVRQGNGRLRVIPAISRKQDSRPDSLSWVLNTEHILSFFYF